MNPDYPDNPAHESSSQATGDCASLRIVIAGATGAVGSCVARLAESQPGASVMALVRRSGAVVLPGVNEVLFDFENPAAYDAFFRATPCDVLFLCLGSTTKNAGREGLVRVERDYPSQLALALAKVNPKARVGLVSSLGADRPTGNYLRAKAGAEKAVMECGLTCVIARPSLLLAERKEFRLAEVVVAKLVAVPFLWFLRHCAPRSRNLWRYAPVRVEDVASALFRTVLKVARGGRVIIDGLDLQTSSDKPDTDGKGNS